MKRFLAVLLTAILALSVLSCSGGGDKATTPSPTTPAPTTPAPTTPAPTTPVITTVTTPGTTDLHFVYERIEADGDVYYAVIGLTEAGKAASVLTVPDTFLDGIVDEIAAEAFKGATALEKLTVGGNIASIGDGIFDGATAMREFVILSTPGNISISTTDSEVSMTEQGMLLGAPSSIKLYVPSDSLGDFMSDYFWENYGAYLYPLAD